MKKRRKNPDAQPVFVSQVIEGGKGTTFYVTTLRSSMAGFDHKPTMRTSSRGRLQEIQQVNADAVEIAESTLYRFSPETQQPTRRSRQSRRRFLAPKAMMASSAKTKETPRSPWEPVVAKPRTKTLPHNNSHKTE